MNTELINKQRIEAYQQVSTLQYKLSQALGANAQLRRRNELLRRELKEMRTAFRYANSQLAKRRPEVLSPEEWQMILGLRGCGQ
jgi:hypothetical protein